MKAVTVWIDLATQVFQNVLTISPSLKMSG